MLKLLFSEWSHISVFLIFILRVLTFIFHNSFSKVFKIHLQIINDLRGVIAKQQTHPRWVRPCCSHSHVEYSLQCALPCLCGVYSDSRRDALSCHHSPSSGGPWALHSLTGSHAEQSDHAPFTSFLEGHSNARSAEKISYSVWRPIWEINRGM